MAIRRIKKYIAGIGGVMFFICGFVTYTKADILYEALKNGMEVIPWVLGALLGLIMVIWAFDFHNKKKREARKKKEAEEKAKLKKLAAK